MLTKFEREVRAAFRLLYGCNLEEGRPAGLALDNSNDPHHVGDSCASCGATFWRHKKARKQKWCPVCAQVRKVGREIAYEQKRAERKKAAR